MSWLREKIIKAIKRSPVSRLGWKQFRKRGAGIGAGTTTADMSGNAVFDLRNNAEMRRISGRVWFLAGQSKALPRLLSGKSQVQLELPSLFFLLGCDDYAHKQEYYAKNCYSYSQDKREFLKKITCQGYGYNSLTQIRYHFTDKLSAFFSNDYHQFNFIIQNKRCQGDLDGKRWKR